MSIRHTTAIINTATPQSHAAGGAQMPGPTGISVESTGLITGYPELVMIPLNAKEKKVLGENKAQWKKITTKRKHYYRPRSPEWVASQALAALSGDDSQEALQSLYHKFLDAGDAHDVLAGVYDKLCRYEYSRIRPELKEAFVDQNRFQGFNGPVWRYYQYLRSGYVCTGFHDPVSFINKIDKSFKFLGRKVWCGVHPVFGGSLREVEKALREEGVYEAASSAIKAGHFGGFVPRYIGGSNRSLSYHALGIAIDIDAPTNPHIVGQQSRILDKILDYLERTRGIHCQGRIRKELQDTGFVCMADDIKMREISSALQKFLDEWIPKYKLGMSVPGTSRDDAEATSLVVDFVKAIGGLTQAKKFQESGIITLPARLFAAMEKARLRSGLSYKTSKDTMHFELLPKNIL